MINFHLKFYALNVYHKMSLIELNEKLNSLGLENFDKDNIQEYYELVSNLLKFCKNFAEFYAPEIEKSSYVELLEKIERNGEEELIKFFLKFLENKKVVNLIKMHQSFQKIFDHLFRSPDVQSDSDVESE